MSIELKRTESVRRAICRCRRRELNRALAHIDHRDENIHEVIHAVHKNIKMSRSLLRLAHDCLSPRVRRQQAGLLHDMASHLAALRDAKVMRTTLQSLLNDLSPARMTTGIARFRQSLQERETFLRARVVGNRDFFEALSAQIRFLHGEIRTRQMRQSGWSVIRNGIGRTYAMNFAAMSVAASNPSTESLHRWRKRVQRLSCQLRFLKPLKDQLRPAIAGLNQLAERLGDDHDLALLSEKLHGFSSISAVDHETLDSEMRRRRMTLRQQAFHIGKQVFSETPEAFSRQLTKVWKQQRD